MQSEDFDNKLRQAAGQHHPNYDENAWAKMEKLLDQHLPQKDDRRRRIIFFLLFLSLLGGGLWLFINKPWQQDRLASNNESKSQPKKEPGVSFIPVKEKDEKEKAAPNNSFLNDQEDKTIKAPGTLVNDPVIEENKKAGSYKGDNNSQKKGIKVKAAKKQAAGIGFDVLVSSGNIATKNKTSNGDIKTDNVKNETGSLENNTVIATSGDNRINSVVNTDKTISQPGLPADNDILQKKADPVKKDTILTEPSGETKEKPGTKKSGSKKTNELFFSVSAGPDISSVGVDNPGKVKLLTGVGLGYIFKDRWTIRTGFYAASKIYTATPADYKPAIPLTNTAYLKNISANCKVYEIPLSLAYNFGGSKKHRTFAALGLSSLIMKKEMYTYEYKYPGAPSYYYTHKENNKYRHYLSILSLSGGYQRRINKTFSVMAEPYIKIPLAGVGYGKVKLAGAGILFSVAAKLF